MFQDVAARGLDLPQVTWIVQVIIKYRSGPHLVLCVSSSLDLVSGGRAVDDSHHGLKSTTQQYYSYFITSVCVFSTLLRRQQRSTFTVSVGRLVSEEEEAASSSSLPLRPPLSPSWPITTSGLLTNSHHSQSPFVLCQYITVLCSTSLMSTV